MVVDYINLSNTLRSILDSRPRLDVTSSPLTTGHDSYTERLRHTNEEFNKNIRSLLTQYEFPEVSVVVTGSHGRLEGGPLSLVEFIIFGNIPEHIQSSPCLETKDLEKSCVSCYLNDPNRVFPNRVLDSITVGGDEKYLHMTKLKLLKEMRDRRLKRKVKDRRGEYQKIMETGLQRHNGSQLIHFDLEKGIAFYENGGCGNGKISSFKYGPLRYVQFRILEELLGLAENGKDEVVTSMPTNTSERLKWLYDKKLIKLGITDLETLIDDYKYFLWLYHIAQQSYKDSGSLKTSVDSGEVTERVGSLFHLLSGSLLKG